MAVITFYAQISLGDAIDRLHDISSIEALLADNVTELAASVRRDPDRHRQLVMLRLDPDDEEGWEHDLAPSADDFGREMAAAHRLSLLLASVSTPLGEATLSPGYLEILLAVAGWSSDRIKLTLRGRHLYQLLALIRPQLKPVLPDLGDWLTGGWQDRDIALECAMQLDRDMSAIRRAIPATARRLAKQTALDAGWMAQHLEAAINGLKVAIIIPEPGTVTWIVED